MIRLVLRVAVKSGCLSIPCQRMKADVADERAEKVRSCKLAKKCRTPPSLRTRQKAAKNISINHSTFILLPWSLLFARGDDSSAKSSQTIVTVVIT